MQIYLHQNGEKTGPFSVYDVKEEVRSERADEDTLGWYQGSEGWKRIADQPALELIFKEAPPRVEVTRKEELEDLRKRLAPERFKSSVRLWARVLDLFLVQCLVLGVVLGAGWLTLQEMWLGGNLLVQLTPAAVLVVIETITISLFGTTPGKWLLRVKIVPDSDQAKIPLSISLYRALTVWWRGVGFWLVPINIFMMALSQAALLRTGKTPWDEACNLRVEYGKIDRNRVFLAIGVALLAVGALNLGFGEEFREVWEESRKK